MVKNKNGDAVMGDNYCLSVGCIVRKGEQVLLVRHTYGGANGKLLIPGGLSACLGVDSGSMVFYHSI